MYRILTLGLGSKGVELVSVECMLFSGTCRGDHTLGLTSAVVVRGMAVDN